jgi:hypothetical protein
VWAHVNTFSVPKRGSTLGECEDAASVSPIEGSDGDVSGRSLRVVVADGASESLLAGKWARWLAAKFGSTATATRSKPGFLTAYRAATELWAAEVERYVEEREQRGAPIQWYEEPGLAKGAFSTVIVLDVSRGTKGHGLWRAAALGDSCVFHVREETVRSSFPLCDAEAFSNQPPLLPSRAADDETVCRHVSLRRADWQTEDSLYVMTDALAAWFLRATAVGERPWESLRDLETADGLEFSTWVALKRDQGELRDDDTTLVRIDLY